MATLFSYIRIFLFLAGTLAGLQVPVFVDQYGKSLQAHYLESRQALNEFQDDADRFFDGSIDALITHYKNSGDSVFTDGGDSIESIYSRNLLLRERLASFRQNGWSAYTQALMSPVDDVKEEVWRNYSYAIQLDPRSVLFGLISGLVLAAFVEMLLRLPFSLLGARRRRSQIMM